MLKEQQQDFYQFLREKKWKDAEAIIESIQELGNLKVTQILRTEYIEARKEDLAEYKFSPYTHPEPPLIKPSEMDEQSGSVENYQPMQGASEALSKVEKTYGQMP